MKAVENRIMTYIQRRNRVTLDEIIKECKDEVKTRKMLGILIQRKIVKYENVQNVLKYSLNEEMIHRYKYNFIYLEYINRHFIEEYDLFKKVLKDGLIMNEGELDETNKLNRKQILIQKYVENENETVKRKKTSKRYYAVNYEILDKYVMNEIAVDLLNKRYSEELAIVYDSLFKCLIEDDIVDYEVILDKMIEMTGLCSERIKTAIEYLQSMEFVDDSCRITNKTVLFIQRFHMDFILTDIAQKRLYEMIFYYTNKSDRNATDEEITINSLLPMIYQKSTIFDLQSKGLIVEKCTEIYKMRNKVEHFYEVDSKYTNKSILMRIEEEMSKNISDETKCKLIYLHFIFNHNV